MDKHDASCTSWSRRTGTPGSTAMVTGSAVTYFRAQALKDADHPDFLGDWI